jgi:acylphosphatase
MRVTRSGRATGRVQGVMFRQTFVRALQKRGLEGGASNSRHRRDEITFTAKGAAEVVEELIGKMGAGQPLNSWGARVESLELLDDVIPIDRHQVTTFNVDEFAWSPDVEFYL